MWWQVAFWILLVPLLIIEIIIYLRSRKFFWLIYALSIFTYVVAVMYMIDRFSFGRNAVMLVLLASAVLMFFVGKQLGRAVKKRKEPSAKERALAIVIGAAIIVIFSVSVIFGKMSDTTTAVSSVKAADIIRPYTESNSPKPIEAVQQQGITVLKRTLTNSFILPIPVTQKEYRACLATSTTVFELGTNSYTMAEEEVGPGETKTITFAFTPYYAQKNEQVTPIEVRVYDVANTQDSYRYAPCTDLTVPPAYTIPVV